MKNNGYDVIIEDEEELVSQSMQIMPPDGFEINYEEACRRIVYCKRCQSNHYWLKCPRPCIN